MANEELLAMYRSGRATSDPKFLKLVNNPLLFNLFLMGKLPMGFIAGLRVKSCDGKQCEISVPYRWMNQNPFRSTYFAVLAMAAEMSTGMLALMMTRNSNPSVSMLVTHLEADFVKKATGITTFSCTQGEPMNELIERTIVTGQGQTFTANSIGLSAKGETEAQFAVQWSFKARIT